MKRRLLMPVLAIALALLLPLTAVAEGLLPDVEEAPGEVGEFDLAALEPTPSVAPEPTAAQTPLPTLEPGSINYPADKVNFEGEIWTILTRQWGLADFQAAGLMSSIYAESSFCPYNAEGYDGVDNRDKYTFKARDSVGFGLCQWTSAGRKSGLYRYAVSHGDANLVWDFDIQMGYMRREIGLSALKATEDLYAATEWAVLWYERPNQSHENSWPGTRYGVARQIYEAHANRPYAEPALDFEAVAGDGGDASGGLAVEGEAALTVRCNYYWRLVCDKPWLAVQRRQLYDPEAWEICRCGYGGETELRLRVLLPPLSRDATLRLNIYCGSGVVRSVPVRYTGKTLPEVLTEWRPLIFAAARAAWQWVCDSDHSLAI